MYEAMFFKMTFMLYKLHFSVYNYNETSVYGFDSPQLILLYLTNLTIDKWERETLQHHSKAKHKQFYNIQLFSGAVFWTLFGCESTRHTYSNAVLSHYISKQQQKVTFLSIISCTVKFHTPYSY